MKRKRRVLKRRLRRKLRRADDIQSVAIIAALGSNDILDQAVDLLSERYASSRERALGDGTFLEWLQTVDWERLIELIMKIIAAFA